MTVDSNRSRLHLILTRGGQPYYLAMTGTMG